MAEKTELSDQLIYGIDLKARRIHFGIGLDHSEEDPGAVSAASVEMAIRAIHRMVEDAPNKPIEIYMNSYGGACYAVLYLIDVILSSPCQFKFYGGGSIMSAATWVMAVCDERNLFPSARVMIHEIADDIGYTKTTDQAINLKESKTLTNYMIELYANNSRMPKEFWDDLVKKDVYLSAEEAIMLGLADKVVEYKKRGNLRKSRQASLNKEVDSKELKKLVKDIYVRTERERVPHIELNPTKKEEVDAKVIIDDTPMPEKPEEPSK